MITLHQKLLGTARRRDAVFAWAILLPTFALLTLVMFYPAFKTLMRSFQSYSLRRPAALGEWTGFENYEALLRSSEFHEVFLRSLLLAAMVLPAEMLIGLAGALLLNEHLRGRSLVRTLVLLPWVLPPIVNGFLWGWLLNGEYGALNGLLYQLHIIDEYRYWLVDPFDQLMWVAIAQVWTRYALPLIIILTGLQFISDSLYEAAQLDGANAWQRFKDITLPLLKPSFALALVVEFIATFHIFDLVWTLTAGGSAGGTINPFTRTLMILNYETVYRRLDVGRGAALAFVILIATLVVGFVVVRQMYKTGMKR
jgi:ABC-type sugar transport system permease subunit